MSEHEERAPGEVLIVGLGLLGGSLGLALRCRGWRVRGLARRPEHARAALAAGVADEAGVSGPELARGAAHVVLCLPISALADAYAGLAAVLAPRAVVSDVGSVKAPIVPRLDAIARRHGHRFVGAHPMAGAETAGMEHARADLYHAADVALCPGATADEPAVSDAAALWRAAGAHCVLMDPAIHDEMVGRTSHLPHVVAACLVHVALDAALPVERAFLAAGGFRDSTRVASGPPDMWTEILEANRGAVIAALDAMQQEIARVRRHLESADRGGLHRYLTDANARRGRWCRSREQACVE